VTHTPNAYAGLLGALLLDPWGPDAACIGKATILETPELQDEAKAMCLGDPLRGIPRCPVINECARWVLPLTRHQDPGGIRAGMTEDERHTARRRIATLKSVPRKRCPKCQQVKPLTAFHQNKSRADECSSYCRTCGSKRRAELRQMKEAVGQ
jgi:RNase P subunit RPR2